MRSASFHRNRQPSQTVPFEALMGIEYEKHAASYRPADATDAAHPHADHV